MFAWGGGESNHDRQRKYVRRCWGDHRGRRYSEGAAFLGLVCFPVTRKAARVRHTVVGDW